jgi:hypothetical protein
VRSVVVTFGVIIGCSALNINAELATCEQHLVDRFILQTIQTSPVFCSDAERQASAQMDCSRPRTAGKFCKMDVAYMLRAYVYDGDLDCATMQRQLSG